VSDKVQIAFLALMGVVVITLGTLVALGHDSSITYGLMTVCGGSGALGVWERLKTTK
jgi:hypothetical protein